MFFNRIDIKSDFERLLNIELTQEVPILALILSQLKVNFNVFILPYSLFASFIDVQYSLMKGEVDFMSWELNTIEKNIPDTYLFVSDCEIIILFLSNNSPEHYQ